MKKLVLVVAMFMFVCGGSIFAMAQDPVKTQPATEKTESTEETTTSEPAKASLVALAANVNDTVVTDTTSKDKPAEPVKE